MERTRIIAEAGRKADLKPYQIDFCIDADHRVGLAGKDVLEVGGSLPAGFVLDGLGVRSWTAVENLEYWGDTPVHIDFPSFTAAAPAPHRVIAGKIEDLPESFHGSFDAVISMAAFQHIHYLPSVLDTLFRALRPGGRLVALVGPIWSAHQGHLLRNVTDALGRSFNFGDSPLPPWGHLLMRPAEAYLELCKKMDRPTAARIVYEVFTSARVNRFLAEDYVRFVQMSAFGHAGQAAVIGHSIVQVPSDVQQHLEARYPGCSLFNIVNLLFDFTRPT